MSKFKYMEQHVGCVKESLNYQDQDIKSRKPPLPTTKKLRKRKVSESILSTITNITSPLVNIRNRRHRSMGSACTKRCRMTSVVSPEPQHVPAQKKMISGSKIATIPITAEHSNGKLLEYKSRLSIGRITLHGESDVNLQGNCVKQTPLEEISEHPSTAEINTKSRDSIASSKSPCSNGSDSVIFGRKSGVMLTDNRTSLPDLRPNNKTKCDSKRSCSHGDVQLKSSRGSANLLGADVKQLLSRRDSNPRHHSSENVLSFEKRRRRLPTVENGVHVLEADQVNYYQMLEEIGRGSYGSVCKCLCHKDNKFYAMKIISKQRLMRKNRMLARQPKGKSNPLEPLQREIAIMKKMDHPNIVKLIEVIDDFQVDNVYMVFELMQHGVVIEVPTDQYIPEDRSRSYFRDLLLGIEYVHYSKIIHRDIKPSNLLLDKNNRIKIADFGVSNMFEGDDDLLNKYAGSPAFQAPEVLNYESRDKYSGKAVDVWAMGITLFCFLYGKCPFFSANMGELCNMIKTEPVTFPDEPIVNPQALDLISRMLSKEPKSRITVLEIKDHPWVTVGGEEPLPSTEEHCSVIEVTEEEVKNSIKIISKLSSLVLAKSAFRGKSFGGSTRAKQKHSMTSKVA